jgi:CMP-N,N'-diacetyllegionaminic acid synthase
MKRNLTVVPARGGSEGIVDKNLMKIQGKELVVRSIIHGYELVEKHNLILSTDSPKIIKCVSKFFGFDIPNLTIQNENTIIKFGDINLHYRGSNLSNSAALISDVMFDIRSNLLLQGIQISNWCLLQPTSPFRNSQELVRYRELIEENKEKEFSMVSVAKVEEMHPARMYQMESNGLLSSLDIFNEFKAHRRQDLPPVYIRDGGYYLMSDYVISRKLQFTKNPIGIIRQSPWTVNIDSPFDLERARLIPLMSFRDDPNEGEIWSR